MFDVILLFRCVESLKVTISFTHSLLKMSRHRDPDLLVIRTSEHLFLTLSRTFDHNNSTFLPTYYDSWIMFMDNNLIKEKLW